MDYDHSYKLLFSHAEMVEDLLRGFVREDWVAQMAERDVFQRGLDLHGIFPVAAGFQEGLALKASAWISCKEAPARKAFFRASFTISGWPQR